MLLFCCFVGEVCCCVVVLSLCSFACCFVGFVLWYGFVVVVVFVLLMRVCRVAMLG